MNLFGGMFRFPFGGLFCGIPRLCRLARFGIVYGRGENGNPFGGFRIFSYLIN